MGGQIFKKDDVSRFFSFRCVLCALGVLNNIGIFLDTVEVILVYVSVFQDFVLHDTQQGSDIELFQPFVYLNLGHTLSDVKVFRP